MKKWDFDVSLTGSGAEGALLLDPFDDGFLYISGLKYDLHGIVH